MRGYVGPSFSGGRIAASPDIPRTLETDYAKISQQRTSRVSGSGTSSSSAAISTVSSSGLFDLLPTAIVQNIFRFMDIPSLSALSQTQRARRGSTKDNVEDRWSLSLQRENRAVVETNRTNQISHNVAALASDDITWFYLVKRRFGIGRRNKTNSRRKSIRNSAGKQADDVYALPPSSCRPKVYGGATWKESYRSLSTSKRIPKTRLTAGDGRAKAIFASRKRSVHSDEKKSMTAKTAADHTGFWVMVGHTENCRTRVVRNPTSSGCPYPVDRRYLELKLCFQNTKSGFGSIALDIAGVQIRAMDEVKRSAISPVFTTNESNTLRVVMHGPWRPKALLLNNINGEDEIKQLSRKCSRFDACAPSTVDRERQGWIENDKSLILRPFEVVVFSVYVSCPQDMVYETDFLSTAASIHIPVTPCTNFPVPKKIRSPRCNNHVDLTAKSHLASAYFLSEEEMWNYYMHLPGGFLSLTDRTSLVPV